MLTTGFLSPAPVTSKAVPSVLASVCWSLQCLISALTQGGRWWTLFLGSRVQSHCGEEETLQTNNTGVCLQYLSHAGLAPVHGAHRSGSRLLHREPSKAGPGLHAPPRSKLLRLRHSGSPQRCRLSWACILCPSQVRAAQVMRYLVSVVTVTYRLTVPAARFSGYTTGTPSQVDVDCPEPQEVLVSKEACLQFGR